MSYRRPKARFRAKENVKRDKGKSSLLSPSTLFSRISDGIKPINSYTGTDVSSWQQSSRRTLKELLKYDEPKCAEQIESIWRAKDKVAEYEKIWLERPYQAIPAYFCLPYSQKVRDKWLICLQGHTTGMHISIGVNQGDESKWIDATGSRDFALWGLSNNLSVMCLEVMSLGERQEDELSFTHDHPCQDAALHSLVLGRTLLGERLVDIAAAAKFLRNKFGHGISIGVLGNSLGGTLALYAAALLDDVNFAILSSCICSYKESLLRRSGRHCIDLYIPSLMKHFECGDVLGLAAPKPLVISHGVNDGLFPLKGFSEAFCSGRAVYRKIDAEHRYRLALGYGGHRFYANESYTEFRKLDIS